MTRLITAGRPVVVLGKNRSVSRDEDRAERLLAGVESVASKLDAPAQMMKVVLVHEFSSDR